MQYICGYLEMNLDVDGGGASGQRFIAYHYSTMCCAPEKYLELDVEVIQISQSSTRAFQNPGAQVRVHHPLDDRYLSVHGRCHSRSSVNPAPAVVSPMTH
jgi:hypothetical protein